MRKILLISFLVIFSSIFLSCQKESINKVEKKILRIVSTDDKGVKYTLKDNYDSFDHLVQIIGENVKSYESMEAITLDGIPNLSGEELRIEVYGEIRNFVIKEISFEQDRNGKWNEETIEKYDVIKVIENKMIKLDTYFSEGIPNGKMQWENKNGKVFEYYFSQDGYGIDGEIIISN